MATQTRYPGSNEKASGSGTATNPNNAYADDNSFAYWSRGPYSSLTQRYYNFGFEIPAGATVNSVTMEFGVKLSKGDNAALAAMQAYIGLSNGARGTEYVKTSLPASETNYSSTLTGEWTVDELNADTKEDGPSIMLRLYSGTYWDGGQIDWDYVRLTVDYTEAAPPTVDLEGELTIPFSAEGAYTQVGYKVELSGVASLGFSASAPYILLNVAHANRLGTLRLWSPDRAYLWAETTNYRSCQITRRFVGNSLLEAYFFKDSDEEYYIPKGGWIEDDEGEWYRIELRLAGKDTVHVIAYSPHVMLKQRITVPESEVYAIEATGTPDEVVKALIDASVRGLPITTAADRTEGTDISEVSRYKNLADEVRRICESNNLGERFTKTSEGFEFDTYPGIDRTKSNTDDNPPAIFSVRYDNLEDWAHSISSVDEATTAYVAGQGEGVLRTIVIVGDAETGEDRREVFRDARDSDDTDVLTERGNQTLMPALEALTAKANTNSNLTYNEDYRLGDLVTVEIPERSIELVEGVWTPFDRYTSTDKRITEVIRSYQEGRYDIDLVFGDAPLTRADKTAALKTDLARLEAI